jgi:hypothetical protein
MFKLAPFKPGKPTEFSLVALSVNVAGKTVEILEVRPVATPNVEYIGAIAVWPDEAKGNTSDGGPGFPPATVTKHHPALGVVVPASATGYLYPGESAPRDLVVNAGFRLTSAESGAVNSIEVVYRVDGEVRRERSRTGVVACVDPCTDADTYAGSLVEWQRALFARHGVEES